MEIKGLVAWTVLVAAAASSAGFWAGRRTPDAPPSKTPSQQTPQVTEEMPSPDAGRMDSDAPPVSDVDTPPEDPVAQPPVEVDDPPPADETILRLRCVIPDGVRATDVGAWFRASPDDVNYNYPATIDGDVVTIHAPFGQGQLSIQVEGCVVERLLVEAPDGQTTDVGTIELRRAVPLRGRVVDGQGQPVTTAFIYPNVGDHSVPLTGTRDDGSFEFDGLPEGEAMLRVECKTMVRREVTFTHSAGSDPIEIVLTEGVLLRGRVLDEHGEPLDTVYASVVDTSAPEDRSRMAFPHIDDDGTFDVRLAAGRYEVSTHLDGQNATEIVDVIEGRSAIVTLRFTAR